MIDMDNYTYRTVAYANMATKRMSEAGIRNCCFHLLVCAMRGDLSSLPDRIVDYVPSCVLAEIRETIAHGPQRDPS